MNAIDRIGHWLKWPFAALAAIGGLYLVALIYLSGEAIWAAIVLGLLSLAFFVYSAKGTMVFRYLFPGLAGMLIFVVFPLLYTVQIGFSNYSSVNLLSFERATAYLLEQAQPGEGMSYGFTLHPDGTDVRILLVPKHEDGDEDDPQKKAALDAQSVVTPPLALSNAAPPEDVPAVPLSEVKTALAESLPLSEVIKRRALLAKVRIKLPAAGGAGAAEGARVTYAGVGEFGPLSPVFMRNPDGSLTQSSNGKVFRPDHAAGFYVDDTGERLQPGYKVSIGLGNYARMVNDPEFRGPFLKIFAWTVVFAGLTVLFTLIVGCTLAVLLNWEALRFRGVYRTLLFLPYAVPGFISILVFKGLFNQNFGEINLALSALLGIRPAWFADPVLAKAMLLIVNTWLGYPYVMVLCTGLIKAIPADLYEASAISGAGPLTNFFQITAPLIVKPLTPLLIASFAFNFNNFVLISLLTGGRPDFLNTRVPAGTTDILVSYTYRIAFQDSGQNFGLAAAISTVIFFLVAMLSVANLRMAKVNEREGK